MLGSTMGRLGCSRLCYDSSLAENVSVHQGSFRDSQVHQKNTGYQPKSRDFGWFLLFSPLRFVTFFCAASPGHYTYKINCSALKLNSAFHPLTYLPSGTKLILSGGDSGIGWLQACRFGQGSRPVLTRLTFPFLDLATSDRVRASTRLRGAHSEDNC